MAETRPSPTSQDSSVTRTSSNLSRKVTLNRNSPQVIANEHHAHGCCNGRYHCDGSKCPNAPIVNPAIGIPLAICTAGLSNAAFGMYKGFRDHKTRKAMKAAYREEQSRLDNLEAEEAAARESATPSIKPLATRTTSTKEMEADVTWSSSEKGGVSATGSKHSLAKETLGSTKFISSEIDGTELAAPPQYAAELDSNEVVRHEKPAR